MPTACHCSLCHPARRMLGLLLTMQYRTKERLLLESTEKSLMKAPRVEATHRTQTNSQCER